MKVIKIKWLDSSFIEGWAFIEGADFKTVEVNSIGWLINENEMQITIACHQTDEGQVHSPMTIPKSQIIETAEL